MPRPSPTQKVLSRFHQWIRTRGYPEKSLHHVSPAFRVGLERIAEVEKYRQIYTRSLSDTESLNVNICGDEFCLFKSKKNGLVRLSIISPVWRLGRISRDEDIDSVVGGIFHFSEQYISRARIINVLFSLRTEFGISSEFRYIDSESIRCDKHTAKTRLKEFCGQESVLEKITANHKSRAIILNFRRFNTLDPQIFSAFFYFLRAYELANHGFFEEAVNALDNIMSVCNQFLLDRKIIADKLNRRDLTHILGFDSEISQEMERLYLLRCHFGAHPASSKWHDFSEIYGEDLEMYFESIQLILERMCEIEKQNRIVEQFPESWSEWYLEQAERVYDAVWFEKIPD